LVITEYRPSILFGELTGGFAFKVKMPNIKPGDSSEPSNVSRSLSMVLGVQDYLFIAGISLLAIGVWLVFGVGWAVLVAGAVLVVAAFFSAWIG
jgi:hypothetical protein